MSRLVLFLLLAAGAASAQTTHVVDNNLGAPTGPNVYTTFAAAHAASFDGDTIQFVPSSISYGDIVVTRRLTVRGSNIRPRTELAGFTVQLGQIVLARINDPFDPHNPSGTRLEGLLFSYFSGNYQGPINGIHISNCYFDNYHHGRGFEGDGMIIENSLFNQILVDGNNLTNLTIRNNIIFSFVGINASVNQASTFTNIDHNIFAYSGGTTGNSIAKLAGRNLIVTNNIFMDRVAMPNGTAHSVFTNNISFAPTGTELPAVGVSNSGTGNLVNLNPRLVLFPSTTTLANVLTTNPRLQTTSPARNAATDGTDMGPFGGTNPFTAFLNGGSITPYVTVLNVTSTVFEGDPLQVGITAVASLPEPPAGSPGLTEMPLPAEAPAFDTPSAETFGLPLPAPAEAPQVAPAETAPAPMERPRTDDAPAERRSTSDQ